MAEVRCWCCDLFVLMDEIVALDGMCGMCKFNKELCFAQDEVCEAFIFRKGLHTQKTIPKHFKKQKTATKGS